MLCSRSEQETIDAGQALARSLPSRAVVLLIGNLGAGKTTFTKGMVAGLGVGEADEVSSPTFTLIHEYGDPPKLYHIDLYRLEEERQVASLGLDEIFDRNAIVVIEWGERFPRLMPAKRVEVRINYGDDEDERNIKIIDLPSTNTLPQSVP